MHSFYSPEWFQQKVIMSSSRRLYYNIKPKVSRFHWKSSHHTKNQEDCKPNEGQSIDTNIEMTDILELRKQPL